MASNLQLYKRNAKLQKWSGIVKDCRNSGLSVKEWCQAKGISINTYYKWQGRVFKAAEQAVNEEPEFVEVNYQEPEGSKEAIARVHKEGLEIEILSVPVLMRILGC
ncbi:MAG: hypothetical protein IJ091_10820 [Oscillospiraceae bacterium]|nr:hypothetical protein [Oscillospiraceae bacterium]